MSWLNGCQKPPRDLGGYFLLGLLIPNAPQRLVRADEEVSEGGHD